MPSSHPSLRRFCPNQHCQLVLFCLLSPLCKCDCSCKISICPSLPLPPIIFGCGEREYTDKVIYTALMMVVVTGLSNIVPIKRLIHMEWVAPAGSICDFVLFVFYMIIQCFSACMPESKLLFLCKLAFQFWDSSTGRHSPAPTGSSVFASSPSRFIPRPAMHSDIRFSWWAPHP